MNKRVAVHTLGCKLNFAESATLADRFVDEGQDVVDFDAAADTYVINTCSVTENANKDCRALIRRVRRRAPQARIVITGCYAQLKPDEIAAIEGVDAVLGADEKFDVSRYLQTEHAEDTVMHSCEISQVRDFHSSSSTSQRTRSFLKIQDGCDYPCTYCTIPMARGRSRSSSIAEVLSEAQKLANQGVKEIVLTGVNIGDFGRQMGRAGTEDFAGLLRALDAVKGIERYRISSIEPNLLSKEIIDFVADSERFMPHFHIPLQSGSPSILKKMKRRYTRDLYAERVRYIKERMPHAGIGVDVIVGFPSESDADFEQTYRFIERLPVSYLHVFTYSERPDTEAIDMKPIVPMQERRIRNKKLQELSDRKKAGFLEENKNSQRQVLFEKRRNDGSIQGYTDNYIQIKASGTPAWENQIVDWVV